jgi:hypothetical protein
MKRQTLIPAKRDKSGLKWALPGAVSVEERNETHTLGTCCHNNDGLFGLFR